jgi:two-component system cell cycle response regulator
MGKIFKVTVFGLAPNEQNTLASIFKLAASRPRQYAIVEALEHPDIVMVDAEDANAMSSFRSFSVHNDKIPAVLVAKSVPQESVQEKRYLRRPLILKRVLETLDKVTIEELQHVPELVVGGEDGALDEEAYAALRTAQSAVKTSRSGVKALVVDDALSVRKSMEIQLGLYGMEIDFAETGEAGLQYTEKNVYDIIFLDLMLPGIDGFKVCKVVKTHKLSKNTPVIMLTGKGGTIDKLRGTMAGANEYLTKPVEQAELKEVIKKYLPSITQLNA